jgi:signal transduction histidine kinase
VSGRYLVVARTIDEAMVTALRRQTQVEFSLQSPRTSDPSQKLVVWIADDSILVVEIQLTGMNDQKLANVFVQFPRDITARSYRTTVLARNSFIFGSVAALLMLLMLLQRIVIGPLTAIREHSDRIAEEGLATEPLVLTGNDEIGQLANAFDKMVNRLSDTQNQLTHASRAAGRSQVASNVIHNVGNVLTNVNSLLDAASGRVQGLRIGPLDKLASRLKQADANDGLLAATPDYLEGLAGSLKSDQQSLSQLLATLNDNIRHIHDVIRAQRHHADQTINSSDVKLKNVIGEAIACCRARLEQDSVSVNVSGNLSIDVKSDRSLMLQTMINIIGNARHAMRDNGDRPRTLSIDVEPQRAAVLIRIRDNGCGMTEETIHQVFDAHFTTRESGTGLGLHFCAITLKRLDGSIHATSEGPGLGSTFVIELPRCESKMIATALNQSLSTAAVAGAEL